MAKFGEQRGLSQKRGRHAHVHYYIAKEPDLSKPAAFRNCPAHFWGQTLKWRFPKSWGHSQIIKSSVFMGIFQYKPSGFGGTHSMPQSLTPHMSALVDRLKEITPKADQDGGWMMILVDYTTQ